MKQLRTAGAFALACSILCAPVIHAVRADSSQTKTILVFGDSLSEGFHLKSSQAYPALLLDKLRDAGLEYQLVNASQSGGTTAGGLARLPPHLKRKVDIFILELGINDAFLGVPIEKIEANLQSIIDQVKARNPNVRIIICGMQIPNFAADAYVAAFGKMYFDVAEKNHATLVPYLLQGVGGDPNLNLGDGIHPNAAGQKVLAETVWRVLEPIARGVSTESSRSAQPVENVEH
ncbi:MAG TPA: arylesterase [Chthoniobacterales bacterium]|nr:arylesterase [Chthoniobacterales bacterium]